MSKHEQWEWQEPGTAWKGVGLYRVTLTVPSREPLLGRLVIPDQDAKKARVERTALGDALIDYLLSVQKCHPELQILHFCLMPDHLHAVWYVTRPMHSGILSVVRGFWQATKQLGRAASMMASSISPNGIRDNYQEEKNRLKAIADTLRQQLGDAAYYHLSPIFTEMPFVRPMGQRRQLQATIRYIDMNPQRLAMKKMMPEYFCVQEGIEIAGRTYRGVGNIALLQSARYEPVHVRRYGWMMQRDTAIISACAII